MRGRGRISGVACAVLLLVAGTACTAAHPAARKTRVAAPSPPAFPHVEVHRLVGQPVSVVDTPSGTWTALFEANRIAREGADPIEVDGFPSDLVSTPFGVWVASVNGPRGFLTRYDALTGEEEMAFLLPGRGDTSPEQLAYADGLLWVLDQTREELVTLDAASGETLRRTRMDDAPLDVAAVGRAAYVVADGLSSLARVRVPRDDTRQVDIDGVREACTGPSAVTAVDHDVWVACTTGDEVVGFDDDAFDDFAQSDLEHPDRVLVDDEHVLALLGDGPSVAVLARDDGHVERTVRLADEVAPKKPLDGVISGHDLVVVDPGTDRSYTVPLDVLYSDAG